MKRLLILSALVMMTVGTVGCRCGPLWRLWRGAPCNPCGPAPVYGDACGSQGPIITESAPLPGPTTVPGA